MKKTNKYLIRWMRNAFQTNKYLIRWMRNAFVLLLGVVMIPQISEGACLTTVNLTSGGCVPYSGATTNVDLGAWNLTTTGTVSGGILEINQGGDFMFSGGSLNLQEQTYGTELNINFLGNASATFDAELYGGAGIVLLRPPTLVDCPQIGIDALGKTYCAQVGSVQDHQNLFNAWIIFFISMIFPIWFFRRKNI